MSRCADVCPVFEDHRCCIGCNLDFKCKNICAESMEKPTKCKYEEESK